MQWHIEQTKISADVLHVAYLDANAQPLSFRAVVDLWLTNTLFCGFHNQVLSDLPFRAFKWFSRGGRFK